MLPVLHQSGPKTTIYNGLQADGAPDTRCSNAKVSLTSVVSISSNGVPALQIFNGVSNISGVPAVCGVPVL